MSTKAGFLPRRVAATNYVEAINRGRSRPSLIEADDGGRYVVKYQSNAKFTRRLIAEYLAGEIARSLGFLVPETVLIDVPSTLTLPDITDRHRTNLEASWGLNIGFRYLENARVYRTTSPPPVDAETAADILWFDALVMNVDRMYRNTNFLVEDGKLWLVDHDSAFDVHHDWGKKGSQHAVATLLSDKSLVEFSTHALLQFAGSVEDASERMAGQLSLDYVDTLIESIPDEWLHRAFPEGTVVVPRQKYLAFVEQQLADSRVIAARLNQMRAEGYCPERQRRADANRLQITRVR